MIRAFTFHKNFALPIASGRRPTLQQTRASRSYPTRIRLPESTRSAIDRNVTRHLQHFATLSHQNLVEALPEVMEVHAHFVLPFHRSNDILGNLETKASSPLPNLRQEALQEYREIAQHFFFGSYAIVLEQGEEKLDPQRLRQVNLFCSRLLDEFVRKAQLRNGTIPGIFYYFYYPNWPRLLFRGVRALTQKLSRTPAPELKLSSFATHIPGRMSEFTLLQRHWPTLLSVARRTFHHDQEISEFFSPLRFHLDSSFARRELLLHPEYFDHTEAPPALEQRGNALRLKLSARILAAKEELIAQEYLCVEDGRCVLTELARTFLAESQAKPSERIYYRPPPAPPGPAPRQRERAQAILSKQSPSGSDPLAKLYRALPGVPFGALLPGDSQSSLMIAWYQEITHPQKGLLTRAHRRLIGEDLQAAEHLGRPLLELAICFCHPEWLPNQNFQCKTGKPGWSNREIRVLFGMLVRDFDDSLEPDSFPQVTRNRMSQEMIAALRAPANIARRNQAQSAQEWYALLRRELSLSKIETPVKPQAPVKAPTEFTPQRERELMLLEAGARAFLRVNASIANSVHEALQRAYLETEKIRDEEERAFRLQAIKALAYCFMVLDPQGSKTGLIQHIRPHQWRSDASEVGENSYLFRIKPRTTKNLFFVDVTVRPEPYAQRKDGRRIPRARSLTVRICQANSLDQFRVIKAAAEKAGADPFDFGLRVEAILAGEGGLKTELYANRGSKTMLQNPLPLALIEYGRSELEYFTPTLHAFREQVLERLFETFQARQNR